MINSKMNEMLSLFPFLVCLSDWKSIHQAELIEIYARAARIISILLIKKSG